MGHNPHLTTFVPALCPSHSLHLKFSYPHVFWVTLTASFPVSPSTQHQLSCSLDPGFCHSFRVYVCTHPLLRPDSKSGRTGFKFLLLCILSQRLPTLLSFLPALQIAWGFSPLCLGTCHAPCWGHIFLLLFSYSLPPPLQIQFTHPLLQEALSDHPTALVLSSSNITCASHITTASLQVLPR